MILDRTTIRDLSATLHAAKQNSPGQDRPPGFCKTPYLQNGLPYRWEPKPKGNQTRLTKTGFTCEVRNGLLHVQVPLGCHGTDHLGINAVTGDVFCTLCNKGGE